MNIRIIIYLSIIFISNCQSAWRVDPGNFLRIKNQELAQLYENSTGLVIIFWQSTCPCVRRYEERVRKLYEQFAPRGIEFIYMSSNSNESFAHAQAEYKKRFMPLKLIRDEGGVFARQIQARGTPTAVLISPHGEIKYMGWIDNERRLGEHGRIAYLKDALEAYLTHENIKIKTSPMFGCPIR
jgi:hypothetical protein